MEKEKIEQIIAKYRKLASSTFDDDKSWQYGHFADSIEDSIEMYEEDYYETEEDLLNDYNEANAEVDAQWNDLFPEGDEGDAITDFLTN
jgi:hypothetical protein